MKNSYEKGNPKTIKTQIRKIKKIKNYLNEKKWKRSGNWCHT